ncbi:hypothetical protein [Oceanobacillus halophilus]|uniref:hypothetical protein n=1 Tax=Oceanobacillus halophilus TaxID=930130 RepID=UPI00147616F1|nr:hypothetical protein [Oceanobacillus halophilus]
MWNMIMERMPSMLGFFCTFLSFFVPYVVYKVNQKLHKSLDPPWKQEENNKANKQS